MKSVTSGAASAYYLLQLKRNQWKSPKELKEIQLKRLKRIVHYAYNYVPYYRRLFNSVKFKPDYLKSQSDLRKIPTTNKMDLRRNFSNIFPKGVELAKYDDTYTSGSTGIPLKILRDANTRDYSTALVAYCSLTCGLRFLDKIVKIGSYSPHSLRIPNLIILPIPTDSRKLTPIISSLGEIKPDVIYTQPWVLSDLCTSDLNGIEPRLIFNHTSTISSHERDIVRSKFNLEINDTYGAVEFNRMAFECNEHMGLHMITDNSVIEFLEDEETVSFGEMGEMIVTGLNNFMMPLIRYELGDLGVPSNERCSCGRSWPLIKSLEGRTQDIFILKSGIKIYPKIFYQLFDLEFSKNIFCVSQFQVVQEKRDRMILKFVKGKKFDIKIINLIKGKLDNFFSEIRENVAIEVQLVKDIPVESSGKKQKYIPLLK